MPFLWHFTAFDSILQLCNVTEYNNILWNLSMCAFQAPNTNFLAVFKTISYDIEEQHLKSVKNVILTAFNGVK